MSAVPTKPKGHGHQVSVADAAMLFGSAADDSFASILGDIDEDAEEKDVLAAKVASPTVAIEDDAAAATPKAQISALPAPATDLLEPSVAGKAHEVSNSASSPSTLFDSNSNTTTDLFLGSNDDEDWLKQSGETTSRDADTAATTEWNGHQDSHQPYAYNGEVNGTDAGMGYNHYQDQETYYADQHHLVNDYASGYQNGTYQQQDQYHQQEQYDTYGQPNGQYEAQAEEQYKDFQQQPQQYDQNQYFEQQQNYDSSAYSYGQQQEYGDSMGGYQDSHPSAEQYNQYDPAFGQPASYSDQQQQYDPNEYQYNPSVNQYNPSTSHYDSQQQESIASQHDPAADQQYNNGATSAQYNEDKPQPYAAPLEQYANQYDSYNQQQQLHEIARYSQGQEESLDSLGYPLHERAGNNSMYAETAHPSYDPEVHEAQPQDFAGQQEEDLAALSTHENGSKEIQTLRGAEEYPSSPLRSQDTSTMPDINASIAEPEQTSFLADSYTPFASDDYSTHIYQKSGQEDIDDSYVQDALAEDEMGQQQVHGFADWSRSGNSIAREEDNYIDDYTDTQRVYEAGQSGYFDNAAIPTLSQSLDDGQYTRSLGATSPYDPRLAIADPSSMEKEGAYTSQTRAVDAAEERHRAKIPLASFSIHGKLVTFFPTWSEDDSNDVYANGRGGYGMNSSAAPTKVTIRPLRSVVPSNSYASSKNPLDFPGPALEGEANQGSALSRATGASASSSKAKKAAVIKYLKEAATDMSSGISYLSAGKQASEERRTRDRILILQILVLVLEHDGNLVNNPTFDNAAKELLLADQDDSSVEGLTSSDVNESLVSGPSADQKAGFFKQMEGFLMAGQRKEAVDFAVRENMWTHAVIVASGMDRSTWREVVGQFIEHEFTQGVSGHQGLKVAYHLFSGQEPKTTYELFRRKTSLSSDDTHTQDDELNVRLSQWRRSVATILANRSNGDTATLTAIGDGLAISDWMEAAHICYLLSPQTSPMDGYDAGSTRLTLIGANNPEASTLYLRDLDHIILTEVFEYALSLQPVAKGAEPYHGLAYLQSYRLIHAYLLAEMGDVKQAIRYCDSITTLLKHGKMNRYYHPVLLHQLQELSNRLQGDTKSTSWTRKKPTMDGVWGALEGRFTKFIAGEESNAQDGRTIAKGSAGPAVGPFSHYSAITPEARVGGMSRVHSTSDFRSGPAMTLSASRPQSRPGSALSLHPIPTTARSVSEYGSGSQILPSRDSSALSSPKHGLGRESSDADSYNGPYTTFSTTAAPWYGQEGDNGQDGHLIQQSTQPIDTAYYGYEPHGAIQPQFISNVQDDLSSAMNRASIDDRRGSASNRGASAYQPALQEEDEDDLGFGNSSNKAKITNDANDQSDYNKTNNKSNEEVATPEKKKDGELKPASSWFGIGKLWGRSAENAGETKAKKAHLGDKVTFYYDKELKRWVDSSAKDSGSIASTPPPPPRAQTASPTSMGGNLPSGLSDSGPRRILSEARPPPSSASPSILTPPISENGEDFSDYSPTKPGRTRSNLAEGPPALQPTIRPRTLEGGPSRTVSSSAIKKKPINKRYVRTGL